MSPNEQLDTRRNGQAVITMPDPEARLKAKDRRFSAEYKKRILWINRPRPVLQVQPVTAR